MFILVYYGKHTKIKKSNIIDKTYTKLYNCKRTFKTTMFRNNDVPCATDPLLGLPIPSMSHTVHCQAYSMIIHDDSWLSMIVIIHAINYQFVKHNNSATNFHSMSCNARSIACMAWTSTSSGSSQGSPCLMFSRWFHHSWRRQVGAWPWTCSPWSMQPPRKPTRHNNSPIDISQLLTWRWWVLQQCSVPVS